MKKKKKKLKEIKYNTSIDHRSPWRVTPNAICDVCKHKYRFHTCEVDSRIRAICYGFNSCSCPTYIFAS